eukprot:m.858076 g.858076  ORF g.858076 m.858076 type:complete len:122 (-) comp23521_c0_seq59:1031-1396(-)
MQNSVAHPTGLATVLENSYWVPPPTRILEPRGQSMWNSPRALLKRNGSSSNVDGDPAEVGRSDARNGVHGPAGELQCPTKSGTVADVARRCVKKIRPLPSGANMADGFVCELVIAISSWRM